MKAQERRRGEFERFFEEGGRRERGPVFGGSLWPSDHGDGEDLGEVRREKTRRRWKTQGGEQAVAKGERQVVLMWRLEGKMARRLSDDDGWI